MKLHDEDVELNDIVFDISPNRGHGHVVGMIDGYIEVVFSRGIKLKYNEDGRQKDKSEVTLYWRKPIIIKTPKDPERARELEEFYNAFFVLCKNIKNYM